MADDTPDSDLFPAIVIVGSLLLLLSYLYVGPRLTAGGTAAVMEGDPAPTWVRTR